MKRDHGETLRYKLFVELHDTPLMEHRGTAATTFALQARFFWPKLKNDVQKFISMALVAGADPFAAMRRVTARGSRAAAKAALS